MIPFLAARWGLFAASKAFRPVMYALAVLALVLSVFWAGGKWSEREQTIEDLENEIETGDRIDEVDIPTDDAGVLKRLCELSGLGKRCGQEDGI